MGYRIDIRPRQSNPRLASTKLGEGLSRGGRSGSRFDQSRAFTNSFLLYAPRVPSWGGLRRGKTWTIEQTKVTAKQPPPSLPQFGGGTVTGRMIWLAF